MSYLFEKNARILTLYLSISKLSRKLLVFFHIFHRQWTNENEYKKKLGSARIKRLCHRISNLLWFKWFFTVGKHHIMVQVFGKGFMSNIVRMFIKSFDAKHEVNEVSTNYGKYLYKQWKNVSIDSPTVSYNDSVAW